jgi:hypothetical protein
MNEYAYTLNPITFEIFPTEVYSNRFVVFHGTSSVYSDFIEKDGLIVGHAPFDLEVGEELIKLLELTEVKPYDKTKGIMNMNAAQGLKQYIQHRRALGARLSFSYLSYNCVLFAHGRLKGGQILGTLSDAKSALESAIAEDVIDKKIIPEQVHKILALSNVHSTAPGVVYAIKLPTDLTGVSVESLVIQSSNSVTVQNIIGKVVIPADFDETTFDRKLSSEKNKAKLYKAGGLGAELHRREFPEL